MAIGRAVIDHDAAPALLITATGTADASRLAVLAATISAIEPSGGRVLEGPEAVEIEDGAGTPPTHRLVVAHAGRDLASIALSGTESVASVLRGVLAAVTELHGAGRIHGRLDPTHVLVDADGAVTLAGLTPSAGSAVLTGQVATAADDVADDVAGIGEIPHAADDVAGIGELVDWMLTTVPASDLDRLTAQALRRVADRATVADPEARPRLPELDAALAAVLATTTPATSTPTATTSASAPIAATSTGGSRPASSATIRPDPNERRVNWRLTITVALGALALLAAGLALVITPTARDTPAAAISPATAPGPSASTDNPELGGDAVNPGTEPPSSVADPPTDPTALEGVAVADTTCLLRRQDCAATEVVIDGWRWRVGTGGDLALVGDLDCDGGADVVVVDPVTGAAALHIGPTPAAPPGHGWPARFAGHATPPVRSLEIRPGPAGCLVALVQSGSVLVPIEWHDVATDGGP